MAEGSDGDGPPAPLTERGTRTRERLVSAARAVFEELGFPQTRVAHIARRAGAAYGSFYVYFPSKEAIFLEVADRLFRDMTRHSFVPAAGQDPVAIIRGVNRAYCAAYLRNAKMMAIVEQVATFNEEFQQMRRGHRALTVEQSARAIKGWQRAGLAAPDIDPETTARALSAMVDHSLYLWLVQDGDPDGTERLLDTLDAISIRALGLTASPGEGSRA